MHQAKNSEHYEQADKPPDDVLFACLSLFLIIRAGNVLKYAVKKNHQANGNHQADDGIHYLSINFSNKDITHNAGYKNVGNSGAPFSRSKVFRRIHTNPQTETITNIPIMP